MHLSHPETIPLPLVHRKIVFCETSSWCQKGLQMATLKHMHTGGGRGCFMRSSQRGGGGVLEGSRSCSSAWCRVCTRPAAAILDPAWCLVRLLLRAGHQAEASAFLRRNSGLKYPALDTWN